MKNLKEKKMENIGFKIYTEDGEKYFIGYYTREKAKNIKKELDANNEVYDILQIMDEEVIEIKL